MGEEHLLADAQLLADTYSEATKEELVLAARRLGAIARSAGPTTLAVLRDVIFVLVASVASRAREAHNSEFLVEALEVLSLANVGAPAHVDMILTALYVQQ